MDVPLPNRLPLVEGVYDIEVTGVVQCDDEGEYGPRYDIGVLYRDTHRTIRASETLYLKLYDHLAGGDVRFVITVVGTGRDVRYGVKVVR